MLKCRNVQTSQSVSNLFLECELLLLREENMNEFSYYKIDCGKTWLWLGVPNKCVFVVTYSIDITKLSQSNIKVFCLIHDNPDFNLILLLLFQNL